VLDATAEEVHEFTDLLGDHHDLAVLAADLAARAEVDAAPRTILGELIDAAQAILLADARQLGERIYAEKPEAFGRRLRAYWRAWRHPRLRTCLKTRVCDWRVPDRAGVGRREA